MLENQYNVGDTDTLVGLGSLLMYVKSRNMLKLRKTVMRPGKAKVCECSKNSTNRRIVQC